MSVQAQPSALATGAPVRIGPDVHRLRRAHCPDVKHRGDGSSFPSSILAPVARIIRVWRNTPTSQGPEVRLQQEEEAVAWSTRQLADLAQTTVNTIRHYHHLGLLAEPERRSNGYKQYGVKHLVRLLQIRRLVGLGVPLSQIPNDDFDGLDNKEALRQLDAELLATIHRLQQARSDIAAGLCDEARADDPADSSPAGPSLSGANRSLLHISGQICDEQAVSSLQYMVEMDTSIGQDIDTLPADADDATRDRLAQLLAPILVQHLIRCPWLLKSSRHLSSSELVTQQTISEAVAKLYNAAQLDVIGRAILLVQERLQATPRPRHTIRN